MINKIIGKNIKSFRMFRGMNQALLAEMIDVSVQQISKYETGKNGVSPEKLVMISNILKVPVQKLLSAYEEDVDFLMKYNNADEQTKNLIDKLLK